MSVLRADGSQPFICFSCSATTLLCITAKKKNLNCPQLTWSTLHSSFESSSMHPAPHKKLEFLLCAYSWGLFPHLRPVLKIHWKLLEKQSSPFKWIILSKMNQIYLLALFYIWHIHSNSLCRITIGYITTLSSKMNLSTVRGKGIGDHLNLW